MDKMTPSLYLVDVSFYNEQSGQYRNILFSTRSGVLREIDRNLWEKIKEGNYVDIPLPMMDDLIASDILVSDERDELGEILDENKQFIDKLDNLYFVIQPTRSCPFGCGYCGQLHSPKGMSQEVQEATLRRIEEKLSASFYKSLSISWFGAEPLSGIRIIDNLSPRLQQLAHSREITYSAKIITNGLLINKEIANRLVNEYSINTFEITLDGIEKYHDERRFLKTGGATFNKIYNNVMLLTNLPHPPEIIIRCNVDERNRDGVSPLIQKMASDGLQKFVSFYVAPIHSWGNDAHHLSAEKKTFSTWEIEWLIEMQEYGFKVNWLPKRKKSVCFAVRPDAELIDPHGGIYGCSEVSIVPSYEINGKNIHEIGNVQDNQLKHPERHNTFGLFYEKSEINNYDCSSCPMLPTCGGGCPKEWKEGRIPCPSTKFNIKEKIIMHYLKTRKMDKFSEISDKGKNYQLEIS